MMTSMRIVSCLLLAAAVGCLEPTNPCDPDAPLTSKSVTLTGVVRDVYNIVQAGVVVSVAGRPETAITGSDGRYTIANLPATQTGYDVLTTPTPPAVGGVRRVPAELLASCGVATAEVELVIATAPSAPEPEWVRAISPTALLVAFAADTTTAALIPPATIAGEQPFVRAENEPTVQPTPWGNASNQVQSDGALECSVASILNEDLDGSTEIDGAAEHLFRDNAYPVDAPANASPTVGQFCVDHLATAPRGYRVELRQPFGIWQPAQLTVNPWSGIDGGAWTDKVDEVEDLCGAALCSQWTQLEPGLAATQNARCAVVIGVGGQPLEPFASYEVRVITTTRLDAEFANRGALPKVVPSVPSSRLVKAALVPNKAIVMAADESGQDNFGSARAVVALGNGSIAVLGDAEVVVAVDGDPQTAEGCGYNSMELSDSTAILLKGALWENDDERPLRTFGGKERPVALMGNQPTGPLANHIVLRAPAVRNDQGNIVADAIDLPFPDGVLGAVAALVPVAGNVAEGALSFAVFLRDGSAFRVGAVKAGNSYSNLFTPVMSTLGLTATASPFSKDPLGGDRPAWFGKIAGNMETRQVLTLPARREEGGPFENDLVVLDSEGARVVQMSGRADNFNETTATVSVGDRPIAGRFTQTLSCPTEDGTVIEETAVLVVASQGSNELNVISLVSGPDDAPIPATPTTVGARLGRRTASVTLPFSPNDIIDSSGSNDVTCTQPMLWVLGDGGQLVAIDMRTLTIPQCSAGPCVVDSGGRARTGATDGQRIVLGGQGAVSELGYFRPNKNPLKR